MDQLTSLLDFEGKKSFKKDVQSEDVYLDIYFERSIKWLGLFSLALAVVAQLMEEVSGAHIKCFPDRYAGFEEKNDWMKDQMHLSKAFGEYVDVHCATAHVDYGPLVPNDTSAKYTRRDIDALAKGELHLPYRRCILKKQDAVYCECEAQWEDAGKPSCKPPGKPAGKPPCHPVTRQSCPKPKLPITGSPTDYDRMLENNVKYKEKMYHHYFPWYLLMQAIAVLLPMHLWNTVFGEKIFNKLHKIYECTQTQPAELQTNKELMTTLSSIKRPYMTIVFVVKQLYYFFGFVAAFWLLQKYVGYGIQENQVTRCLMEEYAFVICASPANGSIWFVYVIDVFVILLILIGAAVNLILLLVNWLTKVHSKSDLKKLLDKLFEDTPSMQGQLKKLQEDRISDFPFFSRLFRENKHIFQDICISLMSRDEIVVAVDDEKMEDLLEDALEEEYVNMAKLARQTNANRRQQRTEE